MQINTHITLMDADDYLSNRLKNKNLIVFDGECVLCSGFFKFMTKVDKQKLFSFATAQSDLGEALYTKYNLKEADYDTNLVFINGKLYERFHGFFACMRLIGGPYKIIAILEYLPNRVLNYIYYKIARNRYSLFGKRETCLVPTVDLKSRFIDE